MNEQFFLTARELYFKIQHLERVISFARDFGTDKEFREDLSTIELKFYKATFQFRPEDLKFSFDKKKLEKKLEKLKKEFEKL